MKAALAKRRLIRDGKIEWCLSDLRTCETDILPAEHGADIARSLKPHLAKTHLFLLLISPRSCTRGTCMVAGLGKRAQVSADRSGGYDGHEGRNSYAILEKAPDLAIRKCWHTASISVLGSKLCYSQVPVIDRWSAVPLQSEVSNAGL